MAAPSILKECPTGHEECTFGQLQIGDEFIDPALPTCVMRVHILSQPKLAGEYFSYENDEPTTRFAGGYNKRVFRKKK